MSMNMSMSGFNDNFIGSFQYIINYQDFFFFWTFDSDFDDVYIKFVFDYVCFIVTFLYPGICTSVFLAAIRFIVARPLNALFPIVILSMSNLLDAFILDFILFILSTIFISDLDGNFCSNIYYFNSIIYYFFSKRVFWYILSAISCIFPQFYENLEINSYYIWAGLLIFLISSFSSYLFYSSYS